MKAQVLLNLAKEAIKEHFYTTKKTSKENFLQEFDFLNQNGATFVTLKLNNQLRGCIGSLVAHRSLYDDIVSNAKAAAFSDPRFKPLSIEEFENIEIELSVLSEPKRVEYKTINELKTKIKPNIHGVILKFQGHQATFLPQVWEQLSSFELFFEYLCQKAGVRVSCLENEAEIYTYEVQKFQ
ncbi:MAG: AmmeMemoRadiSam system protein A [Arcobacteraceae bacterium]